MTYFGYSIITMEPLTIFLLYSLRFSVIFSVVILWVVAMSDIGSHVRKGLFTTAKLASMAIAVSVVAVGAIAALNAVVSSHGWTEIGPRSISPVDGEGIAAITGSDSARSG